MFEEMLKIFNRLQDDESKNLFDMRVTYLVNKNLDVLLERVNYLYAHSEWTSMELEGKITSIDPKGIIIFGCGHDGKLTNKVLELCKYEVSYFCDNHKYGTVVEGKPVISMEEVVEKYKNFLVIIASSKYGREMYIELVERGFPYSNILFPEFFDVAGVIWASRGKQYFDMFEPQLEEVYVDAGTFDGQTVLDFIKWTDNQYKAIYAFEPMNDMYKVIRQKVEENSVKRIETLNYAAWSKKEKLHFIERGSSSNINNSGEVVVQGMDIDSVVGENKVTFIKMDIEGSELEALKGAKNTIINNRPRLAICIYHKPMDIIEIPSYILSLVPEYKFYIRHYGSHLGETVLYAVL